MGGTSMQVFRGCEPKQAYCLANGDDDKRN
jgi:hypothetical protein